MLAPEVASTLAHSSDDICRYCHAPLVQPESVYFGGCRKLYCNERCKAAFRKHGPLEIPAEPVIAVKRGRPRDVRLARLRGEFARVWRLSALARDGEVCACCGAPAECVHHIVPFSQGGDNDLDNLVSVCLPCHREFHPYLPDVLFRGTDHGSHQAPA